ncbi:MAG TPA: GtrA family protein [Cellvibrionaceae bacterium]
MLRQFSSFLLIGGGATAVQYLVLVILVELTRLPPVASSALAYGAGAIANYMGNYYLTFKSTASHVGSIARFTLVVFIGLGVNTLVFWAGLKLLPHYLLAQLLATGVTLLVNFVLHRSFTFR